MFIRLLCSLSAPLVIGPVTAVFFRAARTSIHAVSIDVSVEPVFPLSLTVFEGALYAFPEPHFIHDCLPRCRSAGEALRKCFASKETE
jgi:hypothetical protein